MTNLRPIILLLTLLGLPLSGLAALGADCSEMQADRDALPSGHAGHGDAGSAGTDDDCPCCDACVAACASACGVAAVAAGGAGQGAYPHSSQRPLPGNRLLPGPAPPVLIQPPIASC